MTIGTTGASHKQDKGRVNVEGISNWATGGGAICVSRRMLVIGLDHLDFHLVDSRAAAT